MDTWKEFDQNIVSHSAAHHLMAVDELVSQFGYARVSDVARQLNITRGSVSISLRPLKKAGLLEQDENRHLRLSPRGQALVDAIKTKRHLMQRLLAEILGVAPEQATIDACKLEHLVSNQTAQRLLSFLRFLESDSNRGRTFVHAWQQFETECAHAPDACPTCDAQCLAEKVKSDSTTPNQNEGTRP